MNATKSFVMAFLVLGLIQVINAQEVKRGVQPSTNAVQATNSNHGSSSMDADLSLSGISQFSAELGEIGSMFMNDDWKEGELVLRSGETIKGWMFKYNVRYQQMQYINENDTMALARPSEVNTLVFDNKTFVTEAFKYGGKIDTGYFELIRDGKTKLLKQRRITQYIVDKSNDDPIDDRYIHIENYFVKMNDKPARVLIPHKKQVCRFFGKDNSKIKAYIKQNKLKCKSEKDLIKLLDYYDSL
jgi:hypothetical protein